MALAAALAVALPVALGALVGFAIRGETQSAWYTALRKPSWQPPSSVFGPVWTVLYVLMGVASWRVRGSSTALALYALQLALNLMWSPLFFKAREVGWALGNIVTLLVALLATTAAFYRVDPVAGALMLPYLAWVAFATALNASIYVKNR